MRIVLCIALLLLCVPAFAGSAEVPKPITADQCREFVKREGVLIAKMRWHQNVQRAQIDAIPFIDEAPDWYVAMIRNWIADAYAFKGSAEEWVESAYNACGDPA